MGASKTSSRAFHTDAEAPFQLKAASSQTEAVLQI